MRWYIRSASEMHTHLSMLAPAVAQLVELVCMLALAVLLSGYERRTMAMLHNRDAPTVYLLLGLGQPIADAGKLVAKSTILIV